MSMTDSAKFWEYWEEKFPNKKGKITKSEIDAEIDNYCFKNDLYHRKFKKFFWKTSKHPLRRLRIEGKAEYCIEIF